MSIKNIYFFYPSRDLGGAQLLFFRCAKFLSLSNDFEVNYIDFKDGFIAGFLNGCKITLIQYTKEKLVLPSDSIVITSSNNMFRVKDYFSNSETIFFVFWAIHPNNIIHHFINFKNISFLSKKSRKRVGHLLSTLYAQNLLHFMDGSNFLSNKLFFKINLESIDYLQIPVADYHVELEKNNKELNPKKLTLGWLGRIDKDKIYSIEQSLIELELLSKVYEIKYYIVGEGSEINRLKELTRNYQFEIQFTGRLFGNDFDKFAQENIDIGLAMGTSALEFSKLGIPVIILDLYKKKFKSSFVKFRILHEQKDYSLGYDYSLSKGGSIFIDLIIRILKNYSEQRKQAYFYVQDNHTINIVGEKLKFIIKNINFSNLELQNIALADLRKIKEANEDFYLNYFIDKLRVLANFKFFKSSI